MINIKGEVLNVNTNKIIKSCKRKDGYYYVHLDNKKYYLHRLLAIAFIPNPDNLPVVNHIDENKSNYDISNLEWCTQKSNMIYSIGGEKNFWYGKLGKESDFQLKKKKKILQLTLDGDVIKIWDSASDAEKILGIKNIGMVCKGDRENAGGFKWKYYVIDSDEFTKIKNN